VNLPGGWELILVLLVVLVVFGSKRLPDSARSLGRSLRIFKAETRGLREDDKPVVPPAAPVYDPYTGKRVDEPAPETDR
jgi:sec-independent protein translocase protein TatA